jgi:hypothetical protein
MGDVGNLSEPEQRAAAELVPTLLDNYETGMRKIRNIRDFIKTIQAGNIDQAKNILSQSANPQLQTPTGVSFTYKKLGE